MTIDQVIEKVKRMGPRLVELTGGEPLAQAASIDLCQRLVEAGYKVMIETSGAFDVSALPESVHIVMDLKCPDSGMEHKNRYENVKVLKPTDDIKFVVASYEDFLWADNLVREHKLDESSNVLISPAFGLVKPHELVAWLLETKLNARLNLQIHKYIWSPKKKGV